MMADVENVFIALVMSSYLLSAKRRETLHTQHLSVKNYRIKSCGSGKKPGFFPRTQTCTARKSRVSQTGISSPFGISPGKKPGFFPARKSAPAGKAGFLKPGFLFYQLNTVSKSSSFTWKVRL